LIGASPLETLPDFMTVLLQAVRHPRRTDPALPVSGQRKVNEFGVGQVHPVHDVDKRLQWRIVAEARIARLFLTDTGHPATFVIVPGIHQRVVPQAEQFLWML